VRTANDGYIAVALPLQVRLLHAWWTLWGCTAWVLKKQSLCPCHYQKNVRSWSHCKASILYLKIKSTGSLRNLFGTCQVGETTRGWTLAIFLHRLCNVLDWASASGCTEIKAFVISKPWRLLTDHAQPLLEASLSRQLRASLCSPLCKQPLLPACCTAFTACFKANLLRKIDTRQEPQMASFARRCDLHRVWLPVKLACWAASNLTVGWHQLSCLTHLLKPKPCSLWHKHFQWQRSQQQVHRLVC